VKFVLAAGAYYGVHKRDTLKLDHTVKFDKITMQHLRDLAFQEDVLIEN